MEKAMGSMPQGTGLGTDLHLRLRDKAGSPLALRISLCELEKGVPCGRITAMMGPGKVLGAPARESLGTFH